VRAGADSFVIRGGSIQAQTIHYTVLPPPGPLDENTDGCESTIGGIDHG
jgi:hypothetical protein